MFTINETFPVYMQQDSVDCGPTCLKMIARYYGVNHNLDSLREKTGLNKTGVNLLGISRAAEAIGLTTMGTKISFATLVKDAPIPCIAHWGQNHFVVIYKITKKHIYVADPAQGKVKYSYREFKENWLAYNAQTGKEEGIILLLQPSPSFYDAVDETPPPKGFTLLFQYLRQYKKMIFQLFIGIIIVSLLQLAFPFLTQSIVDIGISQKDIHFIYMVLIAQIMLFLGRITVEFVRSWILLHVNSRVYISILGDFLTKMMKLPLRFFDSKHTGDILQRMSDHQRVEVFLTDSLVNFIFSLITMLIFATVLAFYNTSIFLIFLFSSFLYMAWVSVFLNKQKVLDYKRFEASSKNQSAIIQMINGMHEIKLSASELQKRWEWEKIQARLFRFNIRSLSLRQIQQAGSYILNEGKNILITFLSAKYVIEGSLSLGEMLAIQYLIGQLNVPIEHLVQFMKSTQDASISLKRLNEVHEHPDEEPEANHLQSGFDCNKNIIIDNLRFSYPGAGNHAVLDNINITIPTGKVTAIVGISGSGKTTLLKLLLKFHDPDSGTIKLGNYDLKNISHAALRTRCGVVMQDGFIFSDTIAANIAIGHDRIDLKKMEEAIRIANLEDFIAQLPLGINTKIGSEGNGISQGQKQRILIARAIYKDPGIILFDEATNALDAKNEKVIMENLDQFFKHRTVIVVAHRLSTVKNADQIIVIDKGKVAETGNHETLTQLKGHYYHLVKNQLELGN